MSRARNKGGLRSEEEYVIQDGDVVLFRFNLDGRRVRFALFAVS